MADNQMDECQVSLGQQFRCLRISEIAKFLPKYIGVPHSLP